MCIMMSVVLDENGYEVNGIFNEDFEDFFNDDPEGLVMKKRFSRHPLVK